jgi:tetratricopeptide (TPR) repeat protein
VNLGQSYAAATDYPKALDHLMEGLDRKERVPSVHGRAGSRAPSGFGRAYAIGYLGLVYGDLGQFELAYKHLEQSLEIVRAAHSRALEGSILTQLAMVQLWQGEWRAALDTAALMQGTAEQVHGPYIYAMSETVRGFANFHLGDWQGIELLRAAAAWLEKAQIGLTLSWNQSCLAEALALSGQHDGAREHATKALARAAAKDLLGEVGALNALGFVEASVGDWPAAEAQFERALRACERKGSERAAAITRLRAAAAAHRRGEATKAAEWLDAATQQFSKMQMKGYLDEASALARAMASEARTPTTVRAAT